MHQLTAPRTAKRRLRALAVAAAVALVAPLTVGAAKPVRAAQPTYFVFTDHSQAEAVLVLTDPAKIKHARDLISGRTDDKRHVIGKILKQKASYNPSWSYHYDPSTIAFFDTPIEVCDADMRYVEAHLAEAGGGTFLPGLHWCPWSSRLVREIPAPVA